ncbi:hypothetical protein MBLNU230_g8076t1 [Neophaeotheca triangularis]
MTGAGHVFTELAELSDTVLRHRAIDANPLLQRTEAHHRQAKETPANDLIPDESMEKPHSKLFRHVAAMALAAKHLAGLDHGEIGGGAAV